MDSPEERQPPDVITSDTENATTIQPEEAPPGKLLKFRKFRAYNTGTWNGPKRENKDVIYHQDNLHRFDSLSSSLNLNSHQKSRGRKLIDEFDFRDLGVEVDFILFGICVVVANTDVDDGTRYWPQHPDQRREGEDVFIEVAESLNLDWKQQMSAIKKVQSRVDV